MVNICQREHRQWDAVKRPLTSDAEGAEGMLTTSKKVYVRHVDTEPLQRCESSAGQRKLTALKPDFPHKFDVIILANNHLLIDLW